MGLACHEPVRRNPLAVLEQRVSDSKPWPGIVRWQWVMRRQGGARVLDLERTSLSRLAHQDWCFAPAI